MDGFKSTNKGLSRTSKGLSSGSSTFKGTVKSKKRIKDFSSNGLSSQNPIEKLQALRARENQQNNYLDIVKQREASEADDRNSIERALHLGKNQGMFSDAFELLGRPGQAIKGFIDPEKKGDMLAGAWDGFAGNRRVSGEKFMGDIFGIESKNPVANWLIGFTGDLLTDPLTYTDAPLKLLGKGIKSGAKLAGKGAAGLIKKLPKGEEALKSILRIKTGAKNSLKDAFNIYHNTGYKDFNSLMSDKQNLVNITRGNAINTLKDTRTTISKIAKDVMESGKHDKLLKKITGKVDYNLDDVASAYMENIYQHIERNGYDLSERDVINSLVHNSTEDGRGILGVPNIRSKKSFNKLKEDMGPLKERIERITGSPVSEDELAIEMADSGKGAFVKVSEGLRKKLFKYTKSIGKTEKMVAEHGIDNRMFGVLDEFSKTGKFELNLSHAEDKLLYNKLAEFFKKEGKIGVVAKGSPSHMEVNGLTRQDLAAFLDDPSNTDLVSHLNDRFNLEDYDHQVAMKTGGVALNNGAKNKMAQRIVNDVQTFGETSTQNVVEVVGITPSVQAAAGVYTDTLKQYFRLDKNMLKITSSRVPRELLRQEEFKFKQVAEVLEGAKRAVYQIPELIGDKSLMEIAGTIDVDGYMRHVASSDTMITKKLAQLDIDDPTAYDLIKTASRGNADKAFMFRKWHGSAKDINEMFGFKMLNTDPIESVAVNLKLLPERFMATNLISSAFDEGIIRQLSKEEASKVQQFVRADTELTSREAIDKAIPPEYRLLDQKSVEKLKTSFEFLNRAGAPSGDVQALKSQIDRVISDGGVIHRGVYNKVIDYGKRLNESGVNELISAVRKYFVEPWKGLALLSAGFHGRNILTNASSAYLAGVPVSKYMQHFAKATKDLHGLETRILPKIKELALKGDKRWRTLQGQSKMISETLSKKELALYNDYLDLSSKSILGANRFTADHYDLMEGLNKVKNKESSGVTGKALKGIHNSYKKVTSATFKLGKLSDEASRMAVFRWANTESGLAHLKKMKIGSPEEFSKYTFFDYNDLSPFEEKYMKSLFPFYTWAKKNIEFHITNISKNPQKYVKMNHALTNWQDSFVDNDDELSDWAKQEYMMPISNSNGKLTLIKFKPSYLELESTANNPLVSLSPVFKLPLEKLTGHNLFTGKEFGNIGTEGMSEIFGNSKGLSKIFDPNADTNSYGPGLVSTRLGGAVSPAMKVLGLKGGVNTMADLMPSMLREEDTTANQIYNIQHRLIQRNRYLRGLRNSGKYLPTQSQVYEGVKHRLSNKGRIPTIGKKR